MAPRLKQLTLDKIYNQMRMIQEKHWQSDMEHIPLKWFYKNAIKNAKSQEDYEMCQALTDSAEKYDIDIDGK